MKYYIRDDDTSYFTSPDELIRAYEKIWIYGPVNLAIIPFSVKTFNHGVKGKFYQDLTNQYFIGDNEELVAFLKKMINENKVNIMLHGYNHAYLPCSNNLLYPFGIPEFIHSVNQFERIKEGKEALEKLFDITIKWFIPPSNALTLETINACDSIGLNIPLLYNLRKRFFSTLYNNPFAFIINRINLYSNNNFPLTIDNHKEILCTSYTSITNFNKSCNRIYKNKVIATHYWEVNQFEYIKNKIIHDIENDYNYSIRSMNEI